MKTIAVATLSSAVLDLIATFGLAGIAILLGFRLSDGEVALLPALFVLIMVPDYFAPLRAFASDFHASLDGKRARRHHGRRLRRARPFNESLLGHRGRSCWTLRRRLWTMVFLEPLLNPGA